MDKGKALETAKQKRTTIRSLTTRLITKVKNQLQESETNYRELEDLVEQLNLKKEQLDVLDQEILNGLDVTDIENEVIKADEYCEEITIYVSRLNRKIGSENLKTHGNVASNVSNQNSNEVERVKIVEKTNYSVKLPVLHIERFNGTPADFQRFWDQFDSSINQNEELSDVNKFNYLRSYCVDAAADAIRGLSLTNDSYKLALDILKERFGNKTLIINSHLEKLLNLTPVKRSTDIHLLRKLFDICKTEVRSLESMGIKSENYGCLLVPILIKLLPKDIVLEIVKKIGPEDKWEVTQIFEILKIEIESREKIHFLSMNVSENKSVEQKEKSQNSAFSREVDRPNQRFSRNSTAVTLINSNEVRKRVCFLCQKEHELRSCELFRRKSLTEKRNFLFKKGICFGCLRGAHIIRDCKIFLRCRICSRRHLDIMCPVSEENNHDEVNKIILREDKTMKDQSLANKTCQMGVLMQTLKVRLRNKNTNKEIIIRAIYDTGSMRSYLSKQMAKEIGYQAEGEEKMIHSLFGGLEETRVHNKYRVYLSSLNRKYLCNFEVYDQDKICSEIPKTKGGPWIHEAKQQGINFTDYGVDCKESKDIHLLIGADIYGKLLTGNFKLLDCGLAAVETNLGWTLMGKIPQINNNDNVSLHVASLHVRSEKIKDLWDLDLLGIRDPIERVKSEDLNRETVELFNETVKREADGRYIVSLPWVEGHPFLPSNRGLAEKRLKSAVKNLKVSGYLMSYQNVLEEWEREGIIEEIGDRDPNGGHFLPHRPVLKENASTKIRPVFDGSAREKHAPSINDCLAKGPNLIELIPSIIHKFRENRIGVSADIRKAFLMIGLNEKDRNFLKFFWYQDGDQDKLRVYRHCRVVFGINVSPFLLAATLTHLLDHIEGLLKKTAEKLKNCFYVDNCITSVNSEEELEIFIKQSKEILATAKFDLRDWHFNSNYLAQEENSCTDVQILGILWDKTDDSLRLACVKEEKKPVTKRSILSTMNKIFDPIGYTNPVTLIPKLLLQSCWKEKFTWDEELPSEIKKKFEKWRDQLDVLREIRIPRMLSEPNLSKGEKTLHVFCDASKEAYATCIFLRTEHEGAVSCRLIQAKTRVAPLKLASIPRLELMACLIGSRLALTVLETIKFDNLKVFYWSDSMNAIYWIRNPKQWATFVQNRVLEIRRLTNPDNWHHVPGSLNPADLPSRGCSATTLKDSKWWEGPNFLQGPQSTWPQADVIPNLEVIDSEMKKGVMIALNTIKEDLEYFERISSYEKIIRITAWLFRFCENTRKKGSYRNFDELSVEELQEAEYRVLRYVQARSFPSKKESSMPFKTFVDEKGITRVQTRICMRNDLEHFKYPILLPSEHNITKLIILQNHYEKCHAGVQILMSVLRERFWIIRCRKTVRDAILKCIVCKRYAVKHVEVPVAPLPEDRVRDARVFEIVGTDLCGPLYLKDGSKSWIVIFSCAVFRPVHLELISNLSTDDFLQALRRFIARRGRPQIIYSDNGLNFVGASRELKAVDWKRIQKYCTICRITWKFNPPSAPWWGGQWERLIGILKTLLRKTLGRACLQYNELHTLVCDIESVVNARPLTYISENLEDLTPLTPDIFLKDVRESGVPDLDYIDATRLRKRFQYRQLLKEQLRARFRSEYLGFLREFNNKKSSAKRIKQGDLVLIQNDNAKRLEWPLARVTDIYPGRDGEFRVAKLKTKHGELIRPYQRLYPLEVGDDENPTFKAFLPAIQYEISKCTDDNLNLPKKASVKESNAICDKVQPKTSRHGRQLKTVQRYGI